jgi:hypothetical protein|uniref:Uncharacterized protein n=1 Tax=Desulfobacca acetoxidans TaxID=60893 RepID=A0A7C5EM75_9BACT
MVILRKNLEIFLGFFWVVASAVALAAAGPVVLTVKDSGRTISVPVGQRLVVDLQLRDGQSLLAPEFDPLVLNLVGQSLQSSFGPQGGYARVVYEFVVVKEGQTELTVNSKKANKSDREKPWFRVRIMAGSGEVI